MKERQSKILGNRRYRVLRLFLFKERLFFQILAGLFILTGIVYPYPSVAMWLGFAFAGYSAIANDSIQTIGTFLSSNADKKWWQLWIFIGGIFLVTMSYSFFTYDGDVSFQRLTTKGFEQAPTSFSFLQVSAPLILLLLTRLRMPVSTTFLLLSTFSASSAGIFKVTIKSLSGYGIAFVTAIAIWFLLARLIRRFTTGEPAPYWTWIQWLVSGSLWSVWLMQDAANIAVFLPRKLTGLEFALFSSYIFIGLGLLFYLKGDKIQEIINEKSEVKDVRGATIIDLVYTLILFFFQNLSNIPMSTTWVFLGLLAGREVAMNLSTHFISKRELPETLRLIRRDIGYAGLGLSISIILAIIVNNTIRQEIAAWFATF